MPILGHCFPCLQFRREEAITKLDFSNVAQLANVSSIHFWQQIWEHERTLEELELVSTRLCSLPPQLFYCQSLRSLNISNNNLDCLPDAIGTLRQLQLLNCSRNFISTVPESLKNCKNLTQLDLSCNNLQRLPDVITCLLTLQELFLNETYLEFLPANFGRLINLRILELRLNNLVTLPKSMGRLCNLLRLDIGGNEFTELPLIVGELRKLRELWIDLNQIRRITANIGKLSELEHFEANGNVIEFLPNNVNSWQRMEVISICANNLQGLPKSLGTLKTLITLKCESCELLELPDSICDLDQLEELVVSHNRLIKLPTTIGMLRKLRFIFLDDNALEILPDEICSCSALSVLSVSHNKLTDLPQNIGHLTNLKVFNIVENCLSTLPVSVLNLVNLNSLWISNNQTQPLVPLQFSNVNTKTRLTCLMLPQNRASTNVFANNEKRFKNKGNNSLKNEACVSLSRKICFEEDTCFNNSRNSDNLVPSTNTSLEQIRNDEQFVSRLMRSPTPYPKELRMMAKSIRMEGKISQKQTQQDVKEARVIISNFGTIESQLTDLSNIHNPLTYIDQNQFVTLPESQILETYDGQPLNENTYLETFVNSYIPENADCVIIHPMQSTDNHTFSDNDYNQQHSAVLLTKSNDMTDMYKHNIQTADGNESLSLLNNISKINDDQTVFRSNAQLANQKFITPPPYHIARNYTKKTPKDLSDYETMRKNQHPQEQQDKIHKNSFTTVNNKNNSENTEVNFNNMSNHYLSANCKEIHDDGVSRPLFGYDYHNNIHSECDGDINEIELIERLNSAGILSKNLSDDLPKNDIKLRSNKKATWLFGVHKNPTVKQITLKSENKGSGFMIGKMDNEEGIYILSIIPNTNASRVLSVYDKLLEVNGHDFTNINLEEANNFLATAGDLINIMLSRK